MAGVDTGAESDRTPAPSVTIRATPSQFTTGPTKPTFWSDYRQRVQAVLPGRAQEAGFLSDEEFEGRIIANLPIELQKRFVSAVRAYQTRSSVGRKLDATQQNALQIVEFKISGPIEYG